MKEQKVETNHWSQVEEKGSYYGILFVFYVYRLLGRFVFVCVLYPVVFYFFAFGRQARKSSIVYLNRVFKERPGHYPAQATLKHSFRHFWNFANSALDKIAAWAGRITFGEVKFPSRPELVDAMNSGRGGIIIGAHLGSLEVGRALSKEMKGFKLNVLVHTSHAQNFNKVLQQINPESQAELLQVSEIGPDTAMLLKDKIDNGEFIAILGDRTPVASKGREVWLPFLGKNAPFPQGPYILAGVLKCPLYMLTCLRNEDNDGFDVYFDKLAENVVLPRKTRQQAIETYAQLYVDKLSQYVARYPYQWFNFFDFWHEFSAENKAQSSR